MTMPPDKPTGRVPGTPKGCVEKAVRHLQRAIRDWESEPEMSWQLNLAAAWLEQAIVQMRERRARPARGVPKPRLSPIIVKMPATQNRRGRPGDAATAKGDKGKN